MKPVKMFSTVGTTPIAVANAISSHLLEFEEGTKVDCYLLIGSITYKEIQARKKEDLKTIYEGFKDNKKYFKHLKTLDVRIHLDETVDIHEHDLVENVAIIAREADKRVIDGDRVVFDITGGRKIMAGSALLAMMILKQKRTACSYEIAYYWLKKFTPENMNKKLYELGFDAHESIFTSFDEIDERVKGLLK